MSNLIASAVSINPELIKVLVSGQYWPGMPCDVHWNGSSREFILEEVNDNKL